jgi:putative heme iron utilization protein
MVLEQKSPVITPREREISAAAGLPVDARGLAKGLLRRARAVTLSTLDAKSGYPFGSVTNIATLADGTPIFFAALLALHSRNMLADSRVALTYGTFGQGDALAQPRLTLVGRASVMEDGLENARQRYIRRHPKGKLYLSLPDARLFRVAIEGVHFGAGPGRNAADVTPAELLSDITGADSLIAAEAAELAALNENAALVERLATRAEGAPGRWQATGLDPEGIDLVDGDTTARFTFGAPVKTPAEFRAALSAL